MTQQRTADRTAAPYTHTGAPVQPRIRRGVRFAKRAFRVVRDLLAILGVCFALLLYIGYQQYQDRAAAGDVACTFTHCL